MGDGGQIFVGYSSQSFCLVGWMGQPKFLFGRVNMAAKVFVWFERWIWIS